MSPRLRALSLIVRLLAIVLAAPAHAKPPPPLVLLAPQAPRDALPPGSAGTW